LRRNQTVSYELQPVNSAIEVHTTGLMRSRAAELWLEMMQPGQKSSDGTAADHAAGKAVEWTNGWQSCEGS